nr:hypothetical protein [Candidatus Levybacteria bacterium]
MKNDKEGESKSQIPEKEFLVPVRGPVFTYVAQGLRPVYEREVQAAYKDGTAEAFMDESRVARLAVSISRQWPDSNNPVPEKPYLELSRNDVAYIRGVLEDRGRGSAAESRLSSEMIRELQD